MRTELDILGDMTFEQFSIVASRDPAFFIEHMIIDEKSGETVILKDFHREWIDLVMKNDRVIVVAPTGSGKTAIVGIGMALWKAFFEKNTEILIVSNTEPQAKGILERIKYQIAENEMLKILEPEVKDTWNKTEIILNRNIKIFCKPYNENLRSYHVDFIIADEISQYKDHTVFDRYLITRISAKKGKIVAFTTPKTAVDLAAKLLKNPTFVGKSYKMIINSPPGNLFGGESIFPERFSIEYLKYLRDSMGSIAFQREYMCDVLSLEDSFFPPKLVVNCWDEELDFSMKTETDFVYMGVDFAVGEGKDADYFVITVIQVEGNKQYIKYIERHRGMAISSQKLRLIELNSIFKPKALRLDESYYGIDVVQELRQNQLPVIGMKFDYQSRKSYLLNLRRLIEDTTLVIPKKNNGMCTFLTDELYLELTSFIVSTTPAGLEKFETIAAHDDMVMSLALAVFGTTNQPMVSRVFYS